MSYINTTTNEYPVTESMIRLAYPNTSFSTPFSAPEEYAVVFQAPKPDYNQISEAVLEVLPGLTSKGHYEQRWEVVALPAEQVEANQLAKQAADTEAVENKIEALWSAADKYTSSYISGVAVGILTIGVMQQKPKSLAVSDWSSRIWDEYYARKALVTVASIDNLDFSAFGPIPYTVPELQQEALG